MRFVNRAGIPRGLGAALLGFLLCGPVFAQYGDQPPDDDIRQTVARVSYLNGGVSYARGDDPDNWQAADLNVPMTLGDRIYTGRGGRAELSIAGAYVRLDGDTDLAALNLTDDTRQLSLTVGSASFQLVRLGQDDVFEVDTPNAAITFDAAGDYRVNVDQDGNSRVVVRRGRALVAAGGGQVTVQSGDEININGLDNPRYDVVGLGPQDGFDRWVYVRAGRVTRSRSRQYVSADIVGVADLDDSGTWQDVPEYGRVWAPARVAADWAPYRDGHWVWQDPWGWTWVSTESWGWAPYHYGRWVTSSSRWYWVPDAPRTTVRYSPALVAFVGGGPGVTVAASGFVGWFPLAPRDPFVPWWGSPRRPVEVRNVTYVNRNYVTVVRHDAFVSGGFVGRAVVRDQAVIRTVVAAPVLRGPIPIVPTTASLRVAVRPGLPAAPRPSAAIIQRPVVVRVAPPPAPPVFAAKVDVIRQNQGAPVAALAAARISEQKGSAAQQVSRIKPAVAEQGRMTLAPATTSARPDRARVAAPVAAPQPISAAPVRGREVATAAKPVAPIAPVGDAKRVERGREAVPAGQPVQPGQPVIQPVKPGQPATVESAPADRQRELEKQQQLQQQQQQQQLKQQEFEKQQQQKKLDQQQKIDQQQQQQKLEQQQKLDQQQKLQQQQQQQKLEQQKLEQQQKLQQQQQQDQRRLELEKQQQQQQQLKQQDQRRLDLEKQKQQQQQEQLRLEQEKRQRATAQQAQPPVQTDQQKRQEVERQQQPQPKEQVQPPPQKQAPPPPEAKKPPEKAVEKKETPKKDDKKKDEKKDEKKDDKPQ